MTEKLKIAVPDDYEPTPGEINNLVYLTCKYTIGWGMRAADLAVVQTMVPEPRGAAGVTELLERTCEYLWDHIAGEPDEFTPAQLVEHMRPVLEEWYAGTTPEERASTD